MPSLDPENVVSQERVAFASLSELLQSAEDGLTEQFETIVEIDREGFKAAFTALKSLIAQDRQPVEGLSLGKTLIRAVALLRKRNLESLHEKDSCGFRIEFQEFSLNLAYVKQRQAYDFSFVLRTNKEGVHNHFSLTQSKGHLFLESRTKPFNRTLPSSLLSLASREDALPFSQLSDIAYTSTYVERVYLAFCRHFVGAFDDAIKPEERKFGFIEIKGRSLEEKLDAIKRYLGSGLREEMANAEGIFHYRIAEESKADHRLNSATTAPEIQKILDHNQNDDWTVLRSNDVPVFNRLNAYALVRRGFVDLAYLDQETLVRVADLQTVPKGIVYKDKWGTPVASSGYIDVVDRNRDSLIIPSGWSQVDSLELY